MPNRCGAAASLLLRSWNDFGTADVVLADLAGSLLFESLGDFVKLREDRESNARQVKLHGLDKPLGDLSHLVFVKLARPSQYCRFPDCAQREKVDIRWLFVGPVLGSASDQKMRGVAALG